jgi:hypothetical protein
MGRLLKAAFVLLSAAVITLPLRSSAEDKPPPAKSGHEHNQHFWDCAAACHDCARVCEACSSHCAQLAADGKKEHLETLRTCQDCATVCTAAASVTSRVGPFSDVICTACADVCKRCGEACAKLKDDAMMTRCAEVCSKCEKACQEMLKHTEHAQRTSTDRR